MTRAQKSILALLAVVDLFVIGLLAIYALREMNQERTAPPPKADGSIACADEILQVYESIFVGDQDSISVVWNERQANIQIALKSPEAPTDQSPVEISPDPSPQILWVALDALASRLPEACHPPESVTLTISVSTPSDIVRYVVLVKGRYLHAWHQGIIDDEMFASLAHYRTTLMPTIEP